MNELTCLHACSLLRARWWGWVSGCSSAYTGKEASSRFSLAVGREGVTGWGGCRGQGGRQEVGETLIVVTKDDH